MNKIKIKSIKNYTQPTHLYDLHVSSNHNFFIGEMGTILPHNCDYMTPNAQAALRNLMETYSRHTRFILTANYYNRIYEPIISRCTVFEMGQMPKPDMANRVANILDIEKVIYKPEDVVLLINSFYPDMRQILNVTQRSITNWKLEVNSNEILESDYRLKIIDILKDKKLLSETKFANIRKLIANHQIKQFTDVYRIMYENIDDIAKNVSDVILIIAEQQYQESFVIDKEISFIACVVRILNSNDMER